LWGFAVASGFTIKNIPTGPGDTFNAQAVFTRGATRYNIQDLASGFGATSLFGSSGIFGASGSLAFNAAPDTVFVNGGNQHPITTFGGQFGYNHNWTPYWSSGFYGAAAAVRYDDDSKLALCGLFGNGVNGSFSNVFTLVRTAPLPPLLPTVLWAWMGSLVTASATPTTRSSSLVWSPGGRR
jgi:hypothetical protein